MIGMGERTTPQGVEILARSLFRAGTVDMVIVVELPKTRAFMHLDTAMTMVDRDAFCVYPFLPDALRSFTLHAVGDGGDFKVEENARPFPGGRRSPRLDKVRVLRAPIDRMGAAREQWDDGNNFLAVAPGVVMGYERNTTTNRYLTDEGIEVVPVVGVGARPRPRWPALHDLPDRARGGHRDGPPRACRTQLPQGARLHPDEWRFLALAEPGPARALYR